MKTSYAVLWREGDGDHCSGRLELGPASLRLACGERDVEVAYRDLLAVWVGRAAADRLCGKPALALERRGGERLLVAPVAQAGLLAELAERLTTLHAEAHADKRLVVVLPIKSEFEALAHVLVADGPPFDPNLAGLDRHEVFVTDSEVVFLFETPDGSDGLERLLAEPWLWRAAADWAEIVDGLPRIAAAAYSWASGNAPAPEPVGLGF